MAAALRKRLWRSFSLSAPTAFSDSGTSRASAMACASAALSTCSAPAFLKHVAARL